MTETEIRRKLKQISRDLEKADELAERAAVATFDIFHVLHFGGKDLSPEGKKIEQHTDVAHDKLGDARGALGDAHYQIESALKRI